MKDLSQLPQTRILYSKKDYNRCFEVKVTYDYMKSGRYASSILKMSTSFRNALKVFANDPKSPCIISKLLLRALSFGMYCSKDHINFISYREQKGLVSFLPFGKSLVTTEDGRWASNGRQTMKPAKFARAILHPRLVKRLNDKHFNNFATKFKAHEESTVASIHPVTFEEAYTENTDTWKYSTSSCMRDKPVQYFYGCFDCYPLVIKDGGGFNMGRAIVWNSVELVDCNNNVVMTAPYLDRIYSSSDFAELLIDHAIKNSMLYRGTSGGLGTIFFNGEYYQEHYLRVKCQSPHLNKWAPYIDTFRYGSCDGITLYSKRIPLDYRYTFDSTHGVYSDNGYVTGYVQSQYDNYQPPELCLNYGGLFYKKGGYDTIICRDDNEYYHINDPAITPVGSYYYKVDSDKIALCQHHRKYFIKAALVKCYNYADKEILVHKDVASLYKSQPSISIDKINKEYKFRVSTKVGNEYFSVKDFENAKNDYYGQNFCSEYYVLEPDSSDIATTSLINPINNNTRRNTI
jgi:hypothetical protein